MDHFGQSEEYLFQRFPRPKSTVGRRLWLERAIAEWESGKPVSESGLRRVEERGRSRERLSEVVKERATPGWLDLPKDAFGGVKLLEIIEPGEIDRLSTMIYHLELGVAT
jgi:hypothetical protein